MKCLLALLSVLLIGLISCEPSYATTIDEGIYVPMPPGCRILETRASAGGTGSRLAPNSYYTLGIDDVSIMSAGQKGNPAGCAVALTSRVIAISATVYVFNPVTSGYVEAAVVAGGPTAPIGAFNAATPVGNFSAQMGISAGTGNFALRNDSASAIDIAVDIEGVWLRIGNQTLAMYDGDVALGYLTVANGGGSTAMGTGTTASGLWSTALGLNSSAQAEVSFASGDSSRASGIASTAMGDAAFASGNYAVAAGEDTTASGTSSVAIGEQTSASGLGAVALGFETKASGHQSTALGSFSDTNAHKGSFIYADASGTVTKSTADNQFMVRASGGVVLYTSTYAQGTAQSTGVYISPGGGSWGTLSDRNAKDTVQPIDGNDVLDRVVAMPLATWHYKAQDSQYRHMGPMAQDFYLAFHLGETDKGIDTIDADGVALAAIQGLNSKLERENAALKIRVEQLEEQSAEIAALRMAVKSLQRDRAVIINTAATP